MFERKKSVCNLINQSLLISFQFLTLSLFYHATMSFFFPVVTVFDIPFLLHSVVTIYFYARNVYKILYNFISLDKKLIFFFNLKK